MPENKYTIRQMTRDEIDVAIGWAALEGWNPGLYDAHCFHAADPGGFLVGLVDGEPVATISVVKYGADFGFLGFYIVKPAFRGKGYGLRLWKAGMEYLGNVTTGLDGVVERQDDYRKSGFALAHRNIRYQGTGGIPAPNDLGIIGLQQVPFGKICTFDRLFFPAERKQFIKCWIRQPGCTSLGFVKDRVLRGYGVIRECRTGYKIGPLFAVNSETAEKLFMALISGLPAGAAFFLDVPEVNRVAILLAENNKMQVVFETARMYRGKAPELPMDKIFGVTSFELG